MTAHDSTTDYTLGCQSVHNDSLLKSKIRVTFHSRPGQNFSASFYYYCKRTKRYLVDYPSPLSPTWYDVQKTSNGSYFAWNPSKSVDVHKIFLVEKGKKIAKAEAKVTVTGKKRGRSQIGSITHDQQSVKKEEMDLLFQPFD